MAKQDDFMHILKGMSSDQLDFVWDLIQQIKTMQGAGLSENEIVDELRQMYPDIDEDPGSDDPVGRLPQRMSRRDDGQRQGKTNSGKQSAVSLEPCSMRSKARNFYRNRRHVQ